MPGLRLPPANGSFIQADTLRLHQSPPQKGGGVLLLQIDDQISFFGGFKSSNTTTAAATATAAAAPAAVAAAAAAAAALDFQMVGNTGGTFLMLNCTSMSQLRVFFFF